MKTVIKIILWTLGSVIGLALIIIGIFLVWPNSLLNNSTLKLAQKILENRGIPVAWHGGSLSAKSASLFRKEIALTFQGFCYSDTAFCSNEIAVTALIDLRRVANPRRALMAASLDSDHWNVKTGDATLSGSARIEFHEPFAVNGVVVAKINESAKAALNIVTQQNKDGLRLTATGEFRERRKRMHLHVSGTHTAHHSNFVVNATERNLLPQLPRVSVEDCQIAISSSEHSESLKVNCPIRAGFGLPAATDRLLGKLLKNSSIKLIADLTREISKEEKPVQGKVQLVARPLSQSIVGSTGNLSLNVKGLLSDSPKKWSYDGSIDLGIQRFKQITGALSGTSWEVPEPFNSLDGEILLNAKVERKMDENTEIPISLKIRLASQTQHLDIDGDGKISIPQIEGQPIALQSRISFPNVRLVLPQLNLQAPPRIFPDSRLVKAVSVGKKDTAPNFEYAIAIQTRESNPIRLSSNLAQNDIPIHLDLKLSDKSPVEGVIKVSEFDLELFRRRAHVEHVQLVSRRKEDIPEIDGKIVIAYTDHTVTLLIHGLATRPKTMFFSDPPLPENQVMAVLLFGRPMEELDPDQQDSVHNTKAALTDGAVTLASMYALASTPVESVGYDPITQIFSAKVRLGDGTSLNVGVDSNRIRQLGIRKHLTKHWDMNTYVEDPFDVSRRSLNTFLEWNYRY